MTVNFCSIPDVTRNERLSGLTLDEADIPDVLHYQDGVAENTK